MNGTTNVPPAETQPPANELVDYDRMVEIVGDLEASPRIKVFTVGKSHEGRSIFLIVAGEPETIHDLDWQRQIAREIYAPVVQHTSLKKVKVTHVDLQKKSRKLKPFVLVHCESFGFEASHVEATLELAKLLSSSKDLTVRRILRKVTVLLMPMMNPDGRMMALNQWERYPLSAGWNGCGNLPGFLLNRDFQQLTQPETQAVHRVFNTWRPVAALDFHEDMVMLGVTYPEVCWAPPFAKPYYPDLDRRVISLINRLGTAIAKEWMSKSYKVLHDPKGKHGFLGLFMLDGRFDLHFDLHGIPVVITESSRTPGSQTWKDRVNQKVSAGLSFLQTTANDVEAFIRTAYRVRVKNIAQGKAEAIKAFVLPIEKQSDPLALAKLVELLLDHGVLVYRAESPWPAYVVPCSQPERNVVRGLLLAEKWNQWAANSTQGVNVIRFDALSKKDQEALENTPLRRVTQANRPAGGVVSEGAPRPEASYSIPNINPAIPLVNELLKLGQEVSWASEPFEVDGQKFDRGTFIIKVKTPGLMAELVKGRGVQARRLAPRRLLRGYRVRAPRVALYTGQGVDERNLVFKADTDWALRSLGFLPIPVTERDIEGGALRYFDLLVVPGGDSKEILEGWRNDLQWNKLPWQLPGQPKGLRQEGLKAVKSFIEEGGGYIGIGAGGASLACREAAGFINVGIKAHSLGTARVYLKVEEPGHPLAFGYNGFTDDRGGTHAQLIPAPYYSEPLLLTFGGPVFQAGDNVKTIATYHRVDYEPWTKQLSDPEPLEQGNAAIVWSKLGRGNVMIYGINPDLRAIWTSTYRLLSNAIFFHVAEGPGEVTT